MSKTKKVVALEVVDMETGEVVTTVPLNGNNPDRVTAGMLRNMNTDRYCVREKMEVST